MERPREGEALTRAVWLGVALAASASAAAAPAASQAPATPESGFVLQQGGAGIAQPGPARAFLYSLVLPGASQYALGQRRWVAYALAEAVGWAFLLDRRGDGRRLREEYKDLAWTAARMVGPASRRDGGFEYYETLSHWSRSGRFDLDPTEVGVQPETDETTFNGSLWTLAMEIHFSDPSHPPPPGDPAYQRALDYYEERAYGEGFAWDWSAVPGEQERFRGLIKESDERLRDATVLGGLLLANHLLSATDGYVSARLRDMSGRQVTGRLRVMPSAPGGGFRLALELQPSGLRSCACARRPGEADPAVKR